MQLRQIYTICIAVGMALSGWLQLAWFSTPPSPDRVGYWFVLLLVVLPLLGLVAVTALFHARSLRLGGPVLLYVTLVLGLSHTSSLFDWLLRRVSFEWLAALLWLATALWLLATAWRAPRQKPT